MYILRQVCMCDCTYAYDLHTYVHTRLHFKFSDNARYVIWAFFMFDFLQLGIILILLIFLLKSTPFWLTSAKLHHWGHTKVCKSYAYVQSHIHTCLSMYMWINFCCQNLFLIWSTLSIYLDARYDRACHVVAAILRKYRW